MIKLTEVLRVDPYNGQKFEVYLNEDHILNFSGVTEPVYPDAKSIIDSVGDFKSIYVVESPKEIMDLIIQFKKRCQI